jgi:hypothetical protein
MFYSENPEYQVVEDLQYWRINQILDQTLEWGSIRSIRYTIYDM